MNLSKYFTLEELTVSETAARLGIPNIPGPDAVQDLTQLCLRVLQPLRDDLGQPVIVTSGYRSLFLNAHVPGSSATSQHCLGQAADIHVNGMSVTELLGYISERYPFDQVIDEYSAWVHVSYSRHCRGERLMYRMVDGKRISSNIA